MITDFDLARALFPKPRDIVEQGMGTKSTMRTEHGRATSDSADGIVTVVLDTDVEGPDAEIECPTSYSVSEGDEVLVYISGTTPVDVVVVGGGDAMSGRINAIEADYVRATELDADVATIGYLKATSATITDLQADTAKVHDLTAQQISAATGFVGDLTASNITAQTIAADSLKLQGIDTQQISADHATIGSLDTTYAKIDLANVANGTIDTALIADAAITDAKVVGVSANKLTAGTIDASNITVTNLNASNITAGTLNGQRIGTGSLSLDKLSEDVYTESEVDGIVDGLNARIDAQIETWTEDHVPTLNNTPASVWTTNDLKAEHVGDICYVLNAGNDYDGYTYRFAYDISTSSYGWVLIKDNQVTAALGRITDLETFESNTSSWITNTDTELTSIKSAATTLTGRVDKTIVETIQLWYSKANTTAPGKPTSQVTSTSTSGNAWRTVVPAYNASYPNYYYCYQWKYSDGTYGWSSVTRDIAMGETQSTSRTASTNASTAQTTANSAIKSSVQLWYTKADTTAPSKPTAQVTTNSASTGNAWNLAVPTYNASYPYYYYCYQQQKADDTWQWSDVVYDRATTENQKNSHDALTGLTTKVETSTFNTLSQTVDTNTANITSLTTITENNGLTSSTNITNTVNTVQQTASGNSSKISSLTTTLGTNADGTTKTGDIVHRTSAVEQDLSGFKTTVSSTYATKTELAGKADDSDLTTLAGRVTTAETNISQNAAAIALRATKNEAYQSAQPNLAPLGSVDFTNVYDATTNPNGYWRSALSFWFTKLDDGWIHVERDNSEGTAEVTSGSFRPSACPSVVPGNPYTVLIEVRNNSSSGTNRVDFYLNQTANNQFWGNVTGDTIDADHVTTTTQINLLTCGQSYVQHAYRIADTEHLTSGTPSPEVFRLNFRCGAGSVASFDFRMSLYDGIYDGPYKPYSGVQLYATQAELNVQADKISLVVDGTSTSSSLVLTDKAINAVTDNLTIKGSDGTTTVISGGEVQANSIKAGDLNVTNINASNSLTIGALSTATQADVLNSNVQVGGRNLLRKTSSFSNTEWKRQRTTVVDGRTIKLTPTTGSAYAKYKVNYLDYSEHSSGDYTLSFEYRVADDATSYTSTQLVAYVGFNVSGRDDEIFNTSYDNYLNNSVSTDITTTWTKCVVTVSIPLGLTSGTTAALVTGSNLTVQFGSLKQNKPTLIRNIKLEKGTRATDWTPAPEDVDAGISSAAQTATNYIVADSSGIKIADSDPANATTFLHLASTFLDFVRGGSSMLKAWLDGAVAKVRVGSESGFNTLTDDEGIKLRSGTTVLSQFATSLIELGKNSSQAVISLLNNNLSISVVESNPNASGSTPHSYTSTITSGDATIEFAPVSSISGDQSFYDAPAKFSMRSMVSSDPVVYAHGYEHIGHDYVSLQASEEDSDGVPSRLAGFYADVMLGGSVAKVYGDTLWLGDGGGWASTGQDYDMLDVISALDKSIPQGTVVTSNPNAVSVATSSNVTLGSITLAAGTWMVVVSTTFASNNSGRRVVYFADDSSVSSVAVSQTAALTQAPADGGMTKYSSFAIVSPTASTTYYCRAWQNSGSTLSCQCYLRAVRIA